MNTVENSSTALRWGAPYARVNTESEVKGRVPSCEWHIKELQPFYVACHVDLAAIKHDG